MKILLTFIFFLFSHQSWAKISPRFYDSLPQRYKVKIHKEYANFLVNLDADLKYKKSWKIKKRNYALELLKNFNFQNYAYAKLVGSKCYFGGYESKIQNGVCRHPQNFKGLYPSKACSGGGFACNKDMFPGAGCVPIRANFQNLSKDCKQKTDFSESNLSTQQFLKLQNGVNQMCAQNKSYDACDSLIESLASIPLPVADAGTAINTTLAALGSINSNEINCDQRNLIDQCPRALREAFSDNYWNGLMGNTSAVAGWFSAESGKMKDARTFCDSSVPKNINLNKLNQQINKNYGLQDEVTQVTKKCEPLMLATIEAKDKAQEKNIAQAYMALDYAKKNKKITTAAKDLIKAKSSIDAVLGLDSAQQDCTGLQKSLAQFCKRVHSCPGSKEATNKLYSNEMESVFKKVEFHLEVEQNLKNIKVGSKEYKETLANYNQLMVDYPALNDPTVFAFLNQIKESKKPRRGQMTRKGLEPNKENFDKFYRKKLKAERKQLDKKLAKIKNTHACLNGQSRSCSAFEDEIDELSFYSEPDITYTKDKELQSMQNAYSCFKNIRENRDENGQRALKDVGEAAMYIGTVGMVLSGAGFVAVAASAAAKQGAKSLAVNSFARSVQSAGNVTGGLGFTASSGADLTRLLDKCGQLAQAKAGSAEAASEFSCQSYLSQVNQSNELNSCGSEIAMEAAFLAMGALGLKAAFKSGGDVAVQSTKKATRSERRKKRKAKKAKGKKAKTERHPDDVVTVAPGVTGRAAEKQFKKYIKNADSTENLNKINELEKKRTVLENKLFSFQSLRTAVDKKISKASDKSTSEYKALLEQKKRIENNLKKTSDSLRKNSIASSDLMARKQLKELSDKGLIEVTGVHKNGGAINALGAAKGRYPPWIEQGTVFEIKVKKKFDMCRGSGTLETVAGAWFSPCRTKTYINRDKNSFRHATASNDFNFFSRYEAQVGDKLRFGGVSPILDELGYAKSFKDLSGTVRNSNVHGSGGGVQYQRIMNDPKRNITAYNNKPLTEDHRKRWVQVLNDEKSRAIQIDIRRAVERGDVNSLKQIKSQQVKSAPKDEQKFLYEEIERALTDL